jgi:pimeloyl-ACP methyl ester carboxylesterase
MGTALVAEAGASSGLTSKRFDARHVSIHYVEGPQNGPSLILLHGLTRDWTSFSVLFPHLVPRFHVFALDLRGHGESGRVRHGYRIAEFADDVSEFVSAITPAGAAVFGHSLGAMIAMCAAEDHSAVSALIVGDSLITPANLAYMYDPLFSQLHALLLLGGSEEELARGIGRIQLQFPGITESIRLNELPGNTDAVLLAWAQTAIRTDPEALQMTLDRTSHAGWDPERILPRIQCPVLLLQGNPELDALLSDSDVALAKKLLSRAEHVRFPLLGHALFMQNARTVLDAIMPFLDKYSTR